MDVSSSSIILQKNYSFEESVREALLFENPTKAKILLLLGNKASTIEKIANSIFNSTVEISSNSKENLERAIKWSKQNKQEKTSFLLKEIFSSQKPETAEESIRFYFTLGGSFKELNKALQSLEIPFDVKKKVILLDIIRKTLSLEQRFLTEKPPSLPLKNTIFKKFFKHKDTEIRSCEEVSETARIFLSIFKEHGKEKILHIAVNNGYNRLVITLIKTGADIHSKFPGTGATPLHTAAYSGNAELSAWLIKNGADVNENSSIEETPLHMACDQRHLNIVKLLVESGAKVNARSTEGNSALYHLCNHDNGVKIAEYLLETGADPTMKNRKGTTPLHFAFLHKVASLAKLLIENGADPSVIDHYRETPFEIILKKELKEKNEPKEFLLKLFSSHEKAQFFLKDRTIHAFLQFCKESPDKLLVGPEELFLNNPLEIPFLLGDRDLAGRLKLIMPPSDFHQALNSLQEKYPNGCFKALIDANARVDKKIVYQLNPPLNISECSTISIEKLASLFNKIEFFVSDQLCEIPKEEIYFDENGSFFQRIKVQKPLANGKIKNEFYYTEKQGFLELKNIDLAKISALKRAYPYVIIKVEGFMMPASLYREEDGSLLIELRLELFFSLLKRINFEDKSLPGYRNAAHIIDSGSKENSIPLENLSCGLKNIVKSIADRTPYTGTPSEDEPEKLELWYQYLELLIKNILSNAIEEDVKASQLPDPTPSAPDIIELAISGLHCGTRTLDDAQFLYDTKFSFPKNIEEQLLSIIERYKTGIADSMVDLTNPHNVHVKNRILQVIDEECGIPEKDKENKPYFKDPIAPLRIDREAIMRIFWDKFIPSQIIDLIEIAINGKNSRDPREKIPAEINKERVLDWFKSHIPSTWEKKRYDKLKAKFPRDENRESKVRYLEDFDILINPYDLKKEGEPNWEKIIEDERVYSYLEKKVQDQLTGKIKRGALIKMLQTFGVFSPS